MPTAALESAIAQLTATERLELISRLWDSLPDDAPPLQDWQRAELDRRIEAADRSPELGIPWEVAMKRLRGES